MTPPFVVEASADGADGADDGPADAAEDADRPGDHLDDVADGAGCTEIWEHLSGSREE